MLAGRAKSKYVIRRHGPRRALTSGCLMHRHLDVRTTPSLDDDVALLQKESQKSGTSFKQTLNHFLRLGLTAAKRRSRKP